MAKLTIRDDTGRGRSFIISDAVTMAGRASTNSIQIQDEKSSRQHFKIERRDDGFYVADMGSTNGTRLNGSKLAIPTQLHSGDVIAVGKFALVFHEDDNAEVELQPVEAPEAPEPKIAKEAAERATILGDKTFQKALSEKPAAAAAVPIYVLKILEGASPGKIYELGAEPLTLGRHASNVIQIDDEAASNYHAEVSREPVGFVVADLGSTNGTKVRGKDKGDFEKVVKMPLRPGTQIKIGKTLIEFQNIGAPAEEDDAPFATAPIDTQKLDAQLNASAAGVGSGPSAGGGSGIVIKVLIAAAIIAIIAAVGLGVWLVPSLLRGTGGGHVVETTTDKETLKAAANLIPNWDFSGESDDDGNPKEFQVQKGSPEVAVSVTPDAQRPGDLPTAPKFGLQISKGGAKSLMKPTIVETHDPIPIDPAKLYEIGGWMRNDDDGIYGLRVTWVEGERSLAEDPIVLKGTQGWGKEPKVATVSPPPWASHARVGVFVQGKSGKVCFDDLTFREKAGAPQRSPSVKNGGIVVQFENAKGAFSASAQGKAVLEEGTLRLDAAESKAASDLSAASKPTLNKGEANTAAYEGRIFDFAQQDFANFTLGAKAGASGVDLSASMELPQDTSSKPMLRFYILGSTAQGEIEITKADGTTTRVAANEDFDDAGVKSVLFNAGKTPQFDMAFPKVAGVKLKREGKRRLVEVKFDTDIQVSFAPEDVAQKQQMLAAAAELKKAVETKAWGDVEAKLKAFNEKYGARFAQAQEEAAKTKDAIESAWKSTQDEYNRYLTTIENAASKDLVESGNQAFKRFAEAWSNTEKAQPLATADTAWKAAVEKYMNSDAEKKAEDIIAEAQKRFDAGVYNIAVSYLQTGILDDKVLSQTKAAEKAKALLAKANDAMTKQQDINSIQDNLKAVGQSFEKSKDYKGAIKAIESDPEYLAHKADLIETQKYLDYLKKKAGQ